MKDQKSMLYGIIGFLAGVVITMVYTSNVTSNNPVGMMSNTSEPRSTVLDQHFIEEMIPHHEGAIDMAKLALTRAKNEEIKTLSKNIIESQTKEIEQMKIWYKDWFGKEVPEDEDRGMGMGRGMMHGGMMNDQTDISALKNAVDFDKAFIEEMIPHHQMAVMMSNMLKNGTNRPEMKQFAEDIITAQSKEIDDMRSWYASWYK